MKQGMTAWNFLLVCGILSSLLYLGADIAGALCWEGYSYLHQTVSELSAIDAPSRPTVVPFGVAYGLLVIAFGIGVFGSAGQNRVRGAVSGLLIGFGVVCLTGPFFPMHLRGVPGSDVPHIVCATVDVVFIFLIVGFGAGLFGKTFRLYSIGTLLVLLLLGFLTGLQGPRIAANLPTPWVGLTERLNILAYLLWFAVLAVILLREKGDFAMARKAMSLSKFGGGALIASGLLFLVREILEVLVGPPPSGGAEILQWVASGRLALDFVSEVLFFAALLLVPGVIALYESLVDIDRVKAASGCGIIGVVIPVLAMLLIVHGRLVYPIYGIHITEPAVAEWVVAIFYGGLHAVYLLMAVATFTLSLAMRHSAYGKSLANFGFVVSLSDVIGSYPFLIGTAGTFLCGLLFAAWFVVVGFKLYKTR